jgi:ribosomal protein S18 acetylase RimI-like enzyme
MTCWQPIVSDRCAWLTNGYTEDDWQWIRQWSSVGPRESGRRLGESDVTAPGAARRCAQKAYAGTVSSPTPIPAVPRSLTIATDIDVLPDDRVCEQRDGYVAVRSPNNPSHHWGNFLLFERAPSAGDGARWERLFEAEFGADARVRHRTFRWDRLDGEFGAADEEFVARGYETDVCVGLTATPADLRAHVRENRAATVRALDPLPGADGECWEEVVELQVAARRTGIEEQPYRDFSRQRLQDLRALFAAGRGAWYVALDPGTGEVAGSCGIVVTNTRGRFQAVDTKVSFRRQGICSRLVVDAARDAATRHGAERFVIAADADYHALGLYDSLGFKRTERVVGVCRLPATEPA